MSGPGVDSSSEVGEVVVMATSGGPHSADHWGRVTADKIIALIEIEPTAPASAFDHRAKVAPLIVERISAKHGQVQRNERKLLEERGFARLAEDFDVGETASEVVEIVTSLMNETMFAAHFQQSSVQDYIYRVARQHFANSIHIERSWFADAEPSRPESIAYYARFIVSH